MKKFISFLSAIMCVITFGVVLSACGEKPVKIEVKDDTLDTELYVGETLNTDSVVLLVTYNNDEVKEVAKNDEMTFSTVDTTTPGDKVLTITYKKLTVNVTITVTREQHEPVVTYEIQTFSLPTFITGFEANSEAFNLKENTYKVGDDNAFVIKPNIIGRKIVDGVRGELTSLEYIPSTFKIEQKVDDVYTEVTKDTLDSIVSIDEQNYAFDFTDSAIGNTYRLTISAETNRGVRSVVHEFEVVDGFNIQSKEMLSVIDNNPNTQSIWAELKTQNNIPNVNPDAVVIHGSFVLDDSDIPTANYYKEGDSDYVAPLKDSLRNWKSLYSHTTPSDKTYTIYGNYNSIDASAIALINIDYLVNELKDDQSSGHSALFAFGGDNNNSPGTTQGEVVVEGLNLIGNANRTENAEYVGGLLMVLTNSKDTLLKNCVASSWLTNMVALSGVADWENSTHILECNFSDSFSNMLYYYGIKNNYIENSSLTGSGGPLFTLTHVDPAKDTSRWANMEVKNSHLETWVNGTEAWFQINNASGAATQVFAMDRLFSGTSQAAIAAKLPLASAKTFKQNERANFMGMIISSGNPLENTNALKGKIVVKDANDNVVYAYDMESQGFKDITENSLQASPISALFPYFMAGDVYATVVGTDLENITGLGELPTQAFLQPGAMPSQETIQKLVKFFSGDYLGIYLNSVPTIGALLGYYDLNA